MKGRQSHPEAQKAFPGMWGLGKALEGAGISAGSIPVPIHPLPSHGKEQPEPQLGLDPAPGGVWEQGIKNRMELDPWECWESPRLTQNSGMDSGMDPGICSPKMLQ